MRIFDIGFHGGEDTAAYLALGHSVVAVEAAPNLVAAGRRRFARAIASGRLRIVESAVGERKEDVTFWLSGSRSVWNSFDPAIAQREGAKATPVTVHALPLADLIETHGPVDYMKMDIEGAEPPALRSLPAHLAPPLLSTELTCEEARSELALGELRRLGYDRFLVVAQNDFSEVFPDTLLRYDGAPPPWACEGVLHKVARRMGWMAARAGLRPPVSTWLVGSSGPFGWLLRGPWYDMASLEAVISGLRDIDTRHGRKGLGWWFDIHAQRAA